MTYVCRHGASLRLCLLEREERGELILRHAVFLVRDFTARGGFIVTEAAIDARELAAVADTELLERGRQVLVELDP